MDSVSATDPDPAERSFHRRLIVGATALLMVFGTMTAVRYLSIGIPWMAFADFATMGVAGLNLGLLRSGQTTLCAHVLISSVLALLVLDNCTTGGFFDPNFGWLYIIPVVGGLLISGRAAVGYGLLVVAINLVFFAVDQFAPGVPDLVPAADHASQSLFNRLTEIGALVGLVVAFSHERSRNATALARAFADAQAASRAKSDFLANMSHELRTPLNAVIGFSELLLEEAADEGRKSNVVDLTRIRTSAQSLLKLINEVLDLSKIESGKLEIVCVPTDLRLLLVELASSLEGLVRKGGNDWRVDLADDLGVAQVDGLRLGQIVTNLVGNSAKFTRGGRIRLAATRQQGLVRIEVHDTGIGIPAHQQELVFESFVQADSSTTRSFGGSGLGLAIRPQAGPHDGGRHRARQHAGRRLGVHRHGCGPALAVGPSWPTRPSIPRDRDPRAAVPGAARLAPRPRPCRSGAAPSSAGPAARAHR